MGISQVGVPSGGVSTRRTAFTSSGSWTAPTGVTLAKVFLVGGGGGGAGHKTTLNRFQAGGGGGGGQVIEQYLTVVPGTTYTVTIGAGGSAGGASATNSAIPGGLGGDSSFGSLLTAFGGGAGGNFYSNSGMQPRVRYTSGGATGEAAQSGLSHAAGGGGGGGIPFSGVITSETNSGTYNDQNQSHPLGQGGHGSHPNLNSTTTWAPYGHTIYSGNSASKTTLKGLYPAFAVGDLTFTSDSWYGGSLGGNAAHESAYNTSTSSPGKSAGGYGGMTGLGFGGGGGGGAYYLNSSVTLTIYGANTIWGHQLGSGKGSDGGGNGAFNYYHLPGSVTNASTAGAANTGGGGGGCSTYGGNNYNSAASAGGSGYCIVEWIE